MRDSRRSRLEALAAVMERRGWTAREVARRTGRDPVTVWRWLNGDRPIPAAMDAWIAMNDRPDPEPGGK